MRIVFVQYDGDYAAAYTRFKQGQAETCLDQEHTVFYVESLAKAHSVVVLAGCAREHDEQVVDGVRSIGVGFNLQNQDFMWRLLDSLQPELVVLSVPSLQVLRWAMVRRPILLPSFADYFPQNSLRQQLKNLRLAAHLALTRYPCVVNHSLNASISVRNLLVPNSKIVPRERRCPKVHPKVKTSVRHIQALQLYYAGAVNAAKGCVDIIEAVGLAKKRGYKMQLKLSGRGDIRLLTRLAEARGVADSVQFLGLTSNPEVLEHMRAADIVLVPTRHIYPEGLPNTINEALSSRTPLVISDHPAFVGRLKHNKEVLIAKANNPALLLKQILRLRNDPRLYEILSTNAETALQNLYVGPELTKVIDQFIRDPTNTTQWVKPWSMETLLARRPSLVDPRRA